MFFCEKSISVYFEQISRSYLETVELMKTTTYFADISKALILTEIGPKRDPATLKLFLGNIERLLKAHAHG